MSGHIPDALALWEEAARASRDPETLLALGRLQMLTGALDRAEQTLREAAMKNPTSVMVQFFLGFVLHGAGRFDEALDVLEASLTQADWARARTVAGDACVQLGEIEKGRRHLELALAEDDSNSETWYSLALTYAPDEPERAAGLLSKAIEVDPSNGNAHRELGRIEWQLGHWDAAERLLNVAINLNNHDAWAHTYFGMLLTALDRPSEAERENREAVRLMPGEPLPLCNLGDTLAKLGDWRGAESAYLEALKLDVNHYLPNLRLAQLMERRGWHRKAKVYFERVLTSDPGNTTATAGLVRLDEK